MQELIRSFLDYSRIGSMEAAFENVNLNDLLQAVISDLCELIDEKDAIIEYAELPVIRAIPLQFRQMFINLLSNSIKYSKPEVQPKKKILSEKISGEEINNTSVNKKINYWKFSVEDNGIGFDPIYSEKIFEAFQRLHSNDVYGGSGIGLAICKKVVLTHKGFINVSSAPGEGSVFNIFIPAN